MLVGDEAVHRGGHCDGNYGAMVHLRWLANTWPVPYGILRSSQLRPLLTPDGKPSRLDLLLPNRDPSRLFPVVRLRRTHDSRPGAAHTFTRFIERRLFAELRSAIAGEARRVRQTALALAEVDALAALANIAAVRDYCRPVFDDSSDLEIVGGRHPVIEQQEFAASSERFVPNDLYLNSTTQAVLVLTGPNMGGKSTYLRQAALIVILAQMGSFVPAGSARLGVVDRVFTRIGASDNLARGRSTFMVEMTETAAILHTATPRSLILLDEVGRGTSTYDGLAIAWAAIEYIHGRTRAKTLFATHYFELTELADRLSGVKNYHVSVKETGGGIVFMRKVEPGAADRSYGIEVAKLAGLPGGVIQRAREVLAEHESAEQQVTGHLSRAEGRPAQLTIFTPLSQPVLEQLRELELDRLTPLEALNLLAELKKQIQ